MDFFVQNIGWFVGAFIIILLALIGSYADKKEKKEQKKDNVENNLEKEIPVQNNITEQIQEQVPDIPNENINENIKEQPKEENFGIEMPEFKNIEDAHMSLEDLEKANYEAIVNGNNDNKEIIEEIENSGHEFDSEIFSDLNSYEQNNELENIQTNEPEQIQEEDNNMYSFDMEEQEPINIDMNTNALETTTEINQTIPEIEEQNQLSAINEINIENELPNIDEITPEQQNELPNINNVDIEQDEIKEEPNQTNDFFFSGNNEYNGVPELGDINPVGNIENTTEDTSNLGLSDDNKDDDIWKF